MKKQSFLIPLFLLSNFYCFSQNPIKIIDSLKLELTKSNTENTKAKIYGDLTWYYSTISTDSALVYGKKALTIAEKMQDSIFLAQTLSDYAVALYVKGNYQESDKLYEKSLKIRKSLKDSMGIASLHYKIGNNFYKTTQLDSAMTYYLKALDFYEKKNVNAVANSLQGNIGAIYMSLKNYPKALEYFAKNIVFSKKNNQYELLANALTNTGNVYLFKKDTLQAINYLNRSIEAGNKVNAYPTLGSAYNNLGSIYTNKKDFKRAKEFILKSIVIREQLNMKTELASSRLTMAGIHNQLGEFKKAKPLLLQNLKIFKEEHVLDKLSQVYLQLIPVYAYEAKPDSVSYYTNLYTKYQDISINEKMLNVTSELETKYQTEKKEKEILSQRLTIDKKEIALSKKNMLLWSLGILAFILALLGYLLYNQQKLKNSQLQKENELKEALTKIENQSRLQKQRLRISRDLHDNIGAQLTFIISSIDNLKYSFKLPKKLSAKLNSIGEFTSITIDELRDTIWAMNKSEITFKDLELRISNFVDKANLLSQELVFNFNIKDNISINKKLTSVQGMNTYRIIQEAVNNALKHAEATKIDVVVEEQNNNLKILIKDNGKGFNEEESNSGNGLTNMKTRVQDMQADLNIESIIKQGTTIILTLNT